jgi:protein subunit release factor A
MNEEKLFSLTAKDFVVEQFSGSGAGGQHRNRHPNCIRIIHPASNTKTQCTKHRSLHQNRKEAFENLCKDKTFKLWLNRKIGEAIHDTEDIEDRVKQVMSPEKLKVEGFDTKKDKWVELESEKK